MQLMQIPKQTMKAVTVSPATRRLSLDARPMPRIVHPSDVLLRVLEVGVCGTDREICHFDYGTPPSGESALVLGHEAVAEVVAVGESVRRVRKGDLVVPMVRRPCPHAHCVPCRSGRQDFCVTGEFTERGIHGAHGFMTEYLVEDESYLRPVPASLRDVAVLVEPLTIAEKALIQLHHLQMRLPWACQIGGNDGRMYCHSALILGAGPVGLLGAMAFQAAGYRTLVYSRESKTSEKAAIVKAIGAEYLSAEDTTVARLPQSAGTVDVIYEAVGASSLAFQAIHALGANGVFIFTGVPGRKGPIEVDTDRLMRDLVLRNQVMLGTVNADKDAFDAAVRDLGVFVDRWPDAVKQLVTKYEVERFEGLLVGEQRGIKNVLSFATEGA
jgi:threonine dehydrogenase-like Zn-dependent dehydrogenase